VLSLEISRNPDTERRRGAEALLTFAREIFIPDSATADLAQRIERLGITSFDALHLASADQSGADVFLTTDDNLCAVPGVVEACFAFAPRTLYLG